MTQQTRFEPFSEILMDQPDGVTTIIQSPGWQDLPWRCQLRWRDGGWNELVAIEVGWPQGSGWPPSRDAGSGDIEEPDPVADPRALTSSQAGVALAKALAGARSLEMSRKVAAEARRRLEAGLPADYPSLLDKEAALQRSLAEHTEAVAAIYQLLVAHGAHNPTTELARVMGVSRATASRRVKAARSKGLLGPAQRGRAGSVDERKDGERV